MRYFAEVNADDRLVRTVIEWNVPGVVPEADPQIIRYVEVTDLDPMPTTGWTYDPAAGAFAPPAAGV